jgi:17beta-estradiol 17-dehydrogenase / very-long-chain 3-oxoacyl-CoA reductase
MLEAATQLLAAIGALVLLSYLCRFLTFIWTYCLAPSRIHKYVYGVAPYAIVTGASDGIGKALAFELYDKGFNLILHGRNEEKTRGVVDAIVREKCEGVAPAAKRDVRYFLADAADSALDVAKIVQQFSDLNITLVVHNVGGSPKRNERCVSPRTSTRNLDTTRQIGRMARGRRATCGAPQRAVPVAIDARAPPAAARAA